MRARIDDDVCRRAIRAAPCNAGDLNDTIKWRRIASNAQSIACASTMVRVLWPAAIGVDV